MPTGGLQWPYIDTGTVLLLCRPCSNWSKGYYQLQACCQASDTICATCSACAPGDIILHQCTGTHDLACTSSVHMTLNVSCSIWLDATALDAALLSAASALLAPHGPTVDPGYLISIIQHRLYPVYPIFFIFFAGYDVAAVYLNCSEDEYFLINQCLRSLPCSVCPANEYEIQPRTNSVFRHRV